MLAKLKSVVVSFSVISLLTVALFVLLNVVCGMLSRAFPTLMLTRSEKITRDFNMQFGARNAGQLAKWLAISDPAEVQGFLAEAGRQYLTGLAYEDFTHFRLPVFKGKFINFTEAGFRETKNQGPWPPSPDYYNVFFFGGSTTMGIGPDWATIASYFQERLERQPMAGKQVKVYNFGRASYFSTQERILFQQLLLDGRIPDLAVFIDGINDFVFSRPNGFERWARVFDISNFGRWRAWIKEQVAWLPLVQAAAVIADRFSSDAPVNLPAHQRVTVPRDQLEAIIHRYLENKRQIEGVAKVYGVGTIFVWQPTPGYNYDLQYHAALNPVYGLGANQRSGQGYALMAERKDSPALGDDFLWLGDIQAARKEPLYLDAVHYTADFSRDIANEIADFMRRRSHMSSAGNVSPAP